MLIIYTFLRCNIYIYIYIYGISYGHVYNGFHMDEYIYIYIYIVLFCIVDFLSQFFSPFHFQDFLYQRFENSKVLFSIKSYCYFNQYKIYGLN